MSATPGTDALLAGLRRICLALPEVTEGLTHGGETWFVRRRSFAKFVDPEQHRLDERSVAFWAAAAPGTREELVAADPDRFFPPRFGGRHWVGMRLDRDPDWAEVREIVVDAYRQNAPKGLVDRLP
ncbi:MmcQ/YjbR family DNA-binding protein [Pseudonocardia pini]|uniref:MmcQ/YjbR family DNA-binding protein n=1 Tax=Pseudonocardia pini TaxID=2758030 RepID=UPI0015F10E86|nr:MmcQ/YjbR family DNA-binding protein [Pseudonocardia pini]